MKEQFQERERDCACIIEWECVRACGCVWLSFCSQSATVATLSASRADNEEEEKNYLICQIEKENEDLMLETKLFFNRRKLFWNLQLSFLPRAEFF